MISIHIILSYIKNIIISIVNILAYKKASRIKKKSCYIDETNNAVCIYQNDIMHHSKLLDSQEELLKGPIRPQGIPIDRRVSKQATFTTREYLYRLDSALLLGKYPIIYYDDYYIKDTVFFSDEHDRFYRQVSINYVEKLKKLANPSAKDENRVFPARCVLLFSRWNHYGHWVPEHLLKLKTLLDALEEDAFNINLIIEHDAPLWKFKILSALGWSKKNIHEWSGEIAEINELYCPSYPVPNYNSFLWLRESLSQGLKLNNTIESERKLYLSRNKLGSRGVINENQLISFLKSKDFEVLYPEEMTLEEQLMAFMNAKLVVGPHGSAFTNLIFSKNVRVIEFFGQHVPLGFYCISRVMGHQYTPLFCKSGSNKSDYMHVEIERLVKYL